MNNVNNFLKENLKDMDNKYVVIGVSGGPDSMALLDIIHKFNKNIKIICAHVHHNLRKESDDEEKFVKKYCEDNNFIFEFLKIENYKDNKFSEEEARRIRYDFFESLIIEYQAKFLFTAHHGDDLVETMLMRIVRGTNFKGYSGINLVTEKENYQILRPLLFLTKDEVLNYIRKNNIPYVVDKSNDSLKYTRNRFRKNILPELKKENSKVHQKFYKLSNTIIEYDRFINDYISKIYDDIVTDSKINLNLYKEEKDIIKRGILEKYLYYIYGDDIVYITDKHICSIMKLSNNKKPNISINLPDGYYCKKEYNKLYIEKESIACEYDYELTDYVNINNKTIKIIDDCSLGDNFHIYLNSEDIKLPLHVRNYKQGDKIKIKNMENYKKVKDIFINEKVPLSERKTYPIVVDDNNEILWLPGLKKSHFDSQKTGKYDIILSYY